MHQPRRVLMKKLIEARTATDSLVRGYAIVRSKTIEVDSAVSVGREGCWHVEVG